MFRFLLLLFCCFCWLCLTSTVTISNSKPRLDSNGNIMDAHDGTIMKFSSDGPFYGYAMGYGNCKEPSGVNGCASGPNGCGFENNHTLGIWKSDDLTNWIYVNDGLPVKDRPEGVYYSPSVNYNGNTKKYVLIINYIINGDFTKSYYLGATSDTPNGPFIVQTTSIEMAYSDMGSGVLFVDDNYNGYMVYNSISNNHGIVVELMSYDYLNSSKIHTNVLDYNVEASTMFKYNNKYYALWGICCCFCQQGSGVKVFVSDNPLGNYTFIGQINRYSNNTIIVNAQQNYVFPINSVGTIGNDGNDKIQWIWTGDRWQSADDSIKAHDYTYFYPLKFDNNGMIQQMEWIDSFNITI